MYVIPSKSFRNLFIQLLIIQLGAYQSKRIIAYDMCQLRR